MTKLIRRLIDPKEDEDKLPAHQFIAHVADLDRGTHPGTRQEFIQAIKAEYGLSKPEVDTLKALADLVGIGKGANRERLHDLLLQGEVGFPGYTVSYVEAQLGL